MTCRRPRLDLSLPDACRQVAEFCAEFPEIDYDDILKACRMVEGRLGVLRRTARDERARR